MENEYVNKTNEILKSIHDTVERQINETYTEYKNNCLEQLDREIEVKRNEIVKNVLDGIQIGLDRSELGIEPIINIRIGVNKIIKLDK